MISFDPAYINNLLEGIKNINDKALIAIYALTPPRRIIPTDLATILNTYINSNDIVKNDFIFGLESKDF